MRQIIATVSPMCGARQDLGAVQVPPLATRRAECANSGTEGFHPPEEQSWCGTRTRRALSEPATSPLLTVPVTTPGRRSGILPFATQTGEVAESEPIPSAGEISTALTLIVGEIRAVGLRSQPPGPEQYLRHLAAVSGVDYTQGLSLTDPRRMAVYFSKYTPAAARSTSTACRRSSCLSRYRRPRQIEEQSRLILRAGTTVTSSTPRPAPPDRRRWRA